MIVLDPAGHKTTVPVKMRQIDYNRWRCEYVSNLIGLHSVNVFFGGVPVKRSPFGVKIAPSKELVRNIFFIFNQISQTTLILFYFFTQFVIHAKYV